MATCAQFDNAFKKAEQKLSDEIIKKKYKLKNSFWGKVPSGGEFPRNSGTSIKKLRLSRIGFGSLEVGWESIQDNGGCDTNACAQPEREKITRGWEESFYSIERFGFATDEICLTALTFREMPAEELAHFEQGIIDFGKYTWEEWCKTRYYHNCANKIVLTVPDSLVGSSGTCDIVKTVCFPNVSMDGWLFWKRNPDADSTPTGDGPIDERYISVNVHPDRIGAISELTIDALDIAAEYLEFEDENMRFLDEGVEMFDVVLGHNRMGARLSQIERLQESACIQTVYDAALLKKTLGTKRVFRDRYSCRYDSYAPRFYPDVTYNTLTLPNAGAYSPLNPATWPRFVRVLPQVKVRNPNGTTRYIINPDYISAPFALSTIFTPSVYKMRAYPSTENYGTATKGDTARDFSGSVKWINEYDAKCNPRREKGHWELDFGAAAEPDRPENGYAYFHRLDHTIGLVNNTCDIRRLTCATNLTTYCYGELVTGESALGLTTQTRGANMPFAPNNNKYLV